MDTTGLPDLALEPAALALLPVFSFDPPMVTFILHVQALVSCSQKKPLPFTSKRLLRQAMPELVAAAANVEVTF